MEQAAVFEALDLPDADISVAYSVALGIEPDRLCEQLIDSIEWRKDRITLWGKSYPQPRLAAWYGDAGASYRYSGLQLTPLPWTPLLQSVRERIESLCDCSFNSVLLNYYRDGRDSMGMHADDEPELGDCPTIASLSLGHPRRFRLKHKRRTELKPLSLVLPSGSVLLMRGATQSHWKHGINKQSAPCGPRVNLTFRRVLTGCGQES